MKISRVESGRAAAKRESAAEKILPRNRPKGSVLSRPQAGKELSPLEKGMAVAEEALRQIPDVREDLVNQIKERIKRGEYQISGEEIAEMMLRRRAADRLR